MAFAKLIRRYGELRAAPPGEARSRGQQFNALVADLLRHWGIDARAGVRGVDGRDEIDVWFMVGNTPYLLEAKWMAKRLSADAATKLAGRVRDRPRGTRGIVLGVQPHRNAVRRPRQPDQPG